MASNDLLSALKAQKDWNKAVIFDHKGEVLASTFKVNSADIVYVCKENIFRVYIFNFY